MIRRCEEPRSHDPITEAEWQELKQKYEYTCLRCGRRKPQIMLTLDHVIPLAAGGPNTISNAQPLCYSCNCRKGAKSADYRAAVELS